VTRIDAVHPATIVRSTDISRRVRIHRLKQTVAIVVWLTIVAIIVLILVLGSRPGPSAINSYAQLIA
jgi:hypothetical protein